MPPAPYCDFRGAIFEVTLFFVRSGVHSSLDLTEFDKVSGLILNPNLKDGHPMRIAPIVHQWDRCDDWIHPFIEKYDEKIFGGPLDQQKTVFWKAEAA
jgi:hypothetical protein